MIDKTQIPHLLSLLDDDSSEILDGVCKELLSFAPELKQNLKHLSADLNSVQKGNLFVIIEQYKRDHLKEQWSSWTTLPTEMEKLEKAVVLLSEYLCRVNSELKLKPLLDELSEKFWNKYGVKDPVKLASFLFEEKRIQGNEDDYYDPQNSNLISVINLKKGIPVSLASIFMLIGFRLGIPIEGCHFPGHFLARIDMAGDKRLIDCFSRGQILDEKSLKNLNEKIPGEIDNIVKGVADAQAMIRRFLANLVRAFLIKNDQVNVDLMISLFKQLEDGGDIDSAQNLTPEQIIENRASLFSSGQLVCHKRYGYRGIVVDVDPYCRATDSWYYSNQTQPDRDQPWLHVLVDGSDQVTYVAEHNLIEDESVQKIIHPLIAYFFNHLGEGRYERNNNPWPEDEFGRDLEEG